MIASTGSGEGSSMLDRFVMILDAIEEAEYLTLTGVVERTGLARSTTHRLLIQMERRRWLFRVGTNYELGPRLFKLGTTGVRNHWFHRSARPALHRLHLHTGQLVHLAFLNGSDVIFWDKFGSGRHDAAGAGQIGGRIPAHAAAVGKALLASQPSGMTTSFRLFPALTEKTISSRAALQKELESVQRKGYAMEAGEFQPDIGCIATTVHAGVDDPSSAYRTTAAISLCVPLDRLDSRLVAPLMLAKKQIMQGARVNPMVDPPASS